MEQPLWWNDMKARAPGGEWVLLELFVGLWGLQWLASHNPGLSHSVPGVGQTAFASYCICGFLVWTALRRYGQRHLGWANAVTLLRCVIVCYLAGMVMYAEHIRSDMLAFLLLALVALSLDGVDGWTARRFQCDSSVGARFDMELDAGFILLLSIAVWQLEQVGAWIMLTGLMRYLFIAAGACWPALKAPLFPSRRRKVVCVVQVVALMMCLLPWVGPLAASIIGAVALVALIHSFGVDTLWLYNTARHRDVLS
ncbi:CDP-alcohol phosphatidyltransferase family protein [Larsenimonas rhizosphaerae]|uniref:CDP-alcohol phosphatidyltransferase family protein n=1 Tax=Larsenimonas rhizosphaerae TaxID=2944682 RepID=UPI002034A543|nr:CDP-alcohol phosphatidyltransferase family protein [Larsenimonas rhizosphaerae]MCM2130322.1 CDP-alcohol phosphatidyltransferase family protein [Larsenimonas rhizosphaerae]